MRRIERRQVRVLCRRQPLAPHLVQQLRRKKVWQTDKTAYDAGFAGVSALLGIMLHRRQPHAMHASSIECIVPSKGRISYTKVKNLRWRQPLQHGYRGSQPRTHRDGLLRLP